VTRRHATTLAACLLIAGGAACKGGAGSKPAPSAPAKPAAATPAALALELPPSQLPSPAALRFVRNKDSRVGVIQIAGAELTLFAVGLGRCDDGWAVQGLYLDAAGKPAATDPILLGVAPPLGQPLQLAQPLPPPDGPRDAAPEPEPHTATVTIDHLSFTRAAGTISLAIGEREAWRIQFDGMPVGLAPAERIAQRGCHMTGYFTLGAQSGPEVSGPVFGAHPGTNLYTARVPLSDDEALMIAIGRRIAQEHTPLEVRDAPLTLDAANSSPVRVYLARRDSAAPDGWTPTPLEGGAASLQWAARSPQGPAELTIKDMKLPAAWTGRLSGTREPLNLRALIMFPTDDTGKSVPIAPPPAWWRGELER
jgi:hypothetical protein